MKYTITLILISLLLSCQNNTEQGKIEVVTPPESKAIDIISPSISKNETVTAPASRVKSQEPNKENAKVKTSSVGLNHPTFRLDSINEWFNDNLKRYLDLSCDVKYEEQTVFKQNFNNTYENSSTKTKKMDGEIFCLKEITTKPYQAKLIYRRNEGGHRTDQVQLVTITSSKDEIYTLQLSFESGWDGHSTLLESQIVNEHLIKRKMTTRFGDSSTHPDSLAKQARREFFQSFKILNNGELEMISSEIKEYNMDKIILDE